MNDPRSIPLSDASVLVAPVDKPVVPSKLAEPSLYVVDGTNCKQHVRISVFFDGTGNNLDADLPDGGQSNVAKLFAAHPTDDPPLSLYKIYIPGIGTYFPEAADKGTGGLDGGMFGLGSGRKGQQRLNLAFERFQQRIVDCDERADRFVGAAIVDIKVAVFGFSRGAAAARAFCRDLAKFCPDEKYQLPITERKVPIEVDFLGLFDTVASVGLPTSVNAFLNKVAIKLAHRAMEPMADVLESLFKADPLAMIALGDPGAAPSAGTSDGHAAWGGDLAISPIVKKCLHLVAAHEWRNSFPLDSALAGSAYPASVTEMVVPGAHSDVGGGYEPGEGGKSRARGSLMSLIPLWIMFEEAGKTVPFYRFNNFSKLNREDFGIDVKSDAGFKAMSASYTYYLTLIRPGAGLGKSLLQHGRLYFAWRFRAIARSRAFVSRILDERIASVQKSLSRVRELETTKALHNREGWPWPDGAEDLLNDARRQSQRDQAMQETAFERYSKAGADERDVIEGEATFAPERERLLNDCRAARAALNDAKMAEEKIERAKVNSRMAGVTWTPDREAELRQAQKVVDLKEDVYLRAVARYDTKANDKALLASVRKYDEQLMEDARKLDSWLTRYPSLKLRPHYRMILEAYRDEFKHGRGLSDPGVIDFFDHCVHDALSGFGSDQTRTSDPRIVYTGQDQRLRYARTEQAPEPTPGPPEVSTA